MTEQTQRDDVKIPTQAAAPAEETLAGAAETVVAEAATEPAPAADAGTASGEAVAEAVVEPASVDAASEVDVPAEPAPAADAGTASDEAVAEAVEGPVPAADAGTASGEVVAEAVVEPVSVDAASEVDAPAEPAPAADAGTASDEAAAARPKKRLRDRRGLRAAVRWTAAVVAFAALGGATAYAVTQPERTEIPGLRTPDDGRWTYPALKLPKLPAGAPRPLDGDHNRPRRHYADVRGLLLPAPAGAKVDKTFPGATGWLPTRDFLEVYKEDDRKELTGTLEQNTLRHIAARAWTMADGTRAEVYLLQFETWGYSSDVKDKLVVDGKLAKAEAADYDTDWDSTSLRDPELHLSIYGEEKPRGAEHVRFGYIQAGDVLALVVFSKAGTQPAVPFHQAVLLQAQLLG
ncbi:hypothetical protein [Streptomyces sp. NPDC026673]|uniref:hypothetical protein n=1 Tax=Streptomyces sp. NPDC026673 TaxID=3155724 RepID=UPI0034040708